MKHLISRAVHYSQSMTRLLVLGVLLTLTACESTPKKDDKQKQEAVRAAGIEALQGLMQKADVFYQTRDYPQAKTFYLEVVKLDPKNLRAHYRLGNIAFRNREWSDAMARYEEVIKLEPRHTRAQYNLAMTHLTKAERHLKFYAANVDSNANLEAVSKLITALEEISNPNAAAARRTSTESDETTSSLDDLLDELAK